MRASLKHHQESESTGVGSPIAANYANDANGAHHALRAIRVIGVIRGYCLCGVEPGPEPPLNSSRPSGNVMDRPFATIPPALARKPVIST